MLLSTVPSKAGWTVLASSSDFNSKAAFERQYTYNYPGGRAIHNGSAIMSPANLSIPTAGTIRLTCKKFAGKWFDGKLYNYRSETFTWKNRVIIDANHPVWDLSIDAQLPYVAGTWPAFWMTPTNVWNCESDIMENWGTNGIRQNTYQSDADPQWASVTTPLTGPAHMNWHTYRVVALKIDASNVEFHYYIDGVQTSTQTKNNFINNPLYVMFDYQTFFPGQSVNGGNPTFKGPLLVNLKNLTISDLDLTGVAAGPITNGSYRLLSSNSGNVVDVPAALTTNGSKCIQYHKNGGTNQYWLMSHIGNHQYVVLSRQSARAIEDPVCSTVDGTQMDIGDFKGSPNQLWTINATSRGFYNLANVSSGKTLDVTGGSAADGAAVDQWTWVGANQEQWLFQP